MSVSLPVWERLMQTPPLANPEVHVPDSSGLVLALSVVEAGLLDSGAARRAVPSAGAVHPYELLVVTRDAGNLVSFRLDPARRVCLRTEITVPDLPLLSDGEAHVLVLTRPWLSMRKYGPRGYLYAQLDAAHLATNLLGTALGAGVDARLRLRIPRRGIRHALGRLAAHREPHSVLTLCSSAPVPAPPGWRFRHGGVPRQDYLLDDLETLCWESLPRDFADRTGLPNAIVSRPLLDGHGVLPVERWRELSRARRSSKGFASGEAAWPEALSAMSTPLPTDLDTGRRLVGMSTHVVRPAEGDHIVLLCHDQEHLREAAAFAVFHADPAETEERPHLVREALFQAGALAHLLYLGATHAGVGVTAVGGFHPGGWRELSGLDESREVLYIVALGREGGQRVKLDRAEQAVAHGE